MNQKFNKRGAVLGWVMAAMVVLTLLLVLSLTISARTMSHVRENRNLRQAELTAKSLAQAVASDLEGELAEGNLRFWLEEVVVGQGEVMIELTGLPEQMGRIELEGIYQEEEKRLSVTVSATLEQAKAAVTVHMKQGENGRWKTERFEAVTH